MSRIAWNKGKKLGLHTEEWKRKLRLNIINNPNFGMGGKKHTEETKLKISQNRKGKFNGEINNNWKGDNVGYIALHQWIKRHKPKALVCENCHQDKKLQLANINGEYRRDISNYEWLCASCHYHKYKNSGHLNLMKQKFKGMEDKIKKSYEYILKNKKTEHCMDCKKIIWQKSIRCNSCNVKFRYKEKARLKEESRTNFEQQLIKQGLFHSYIKRFGKNNQQEEKENTTLFQALGGLSK